MTALPYHLRVARPEEASQLERIGEAAMAMYGFYRLKLSLLKADFTAKLTPGAGHIVVAVTDQDEPVAYCRIRRYGNHLRLHDMFTAPAHNHHGAGRMLLKEAFDIARAEDVSGIYLLTSQNSQLSVPFYERSGFVKPNPETLPKIVQLHMMLGNHNAALATVPGYLPLRAMVKTAPF